MQPQLQTPDSLLAYLSQQLPKDALGKPKQEDELYPRAQWQALQKVHDVNACIYPYWQWVTAQYLTGIAKRSSV